MPLISAEDLISWSARLLEAVDFPRPSARLIAESLVAANLRGVDSHGVQLLPYYIEQVERGDMLPAAEGRIVSASGACLLYDAGNGPGQPAAAVCCEHAARLAH